MYEYKAVVTRVVDGDTVDCSIDLGFDIQISQRVRLLGIDAPESRTTDLMEKVEGLKVKQWLTKKITGQEIKIQTQYDSRGKFGRVLGTLFLEGVNLNAHMLQEGMVQPYIGGKR